MPCPVAVLAVLAATLLTAAGAALVALIRAQPRAVCPLCGRAHPLEQHP